MICGFLHDRYDAISICNYLSDFLVYLFKASKKKKKMYMYCSTENSYLSLLFTRFKGNVFQQHLKTLKHTQICVIIEIFSKIEYLETRTFDNILSLITLIPVTEENSFLFVGTLGIILNSIRNEQLTSEATIDTFKTIAMFLKFRNTTIAFNRHKPITLYIFLNCTLAADLADSFLENEGLEVVLNQLYEWGYTEQISQHAMMIFMYLSYDKSTMEFMIQNRLVETVTGLMRNHTSNQSICESGLTFLRNALRQRETKFTAIQQKDVVVVAKVFEANMQNPVVCKKACCIIQNLAFSLGSKNAITKQAPNIVRLILEALKLHYQKSKSLCVDAMSALRNFAAGEFVFSLLPLLPPKEIISIIIEITRMYHSDQRVCACACGLLWNLFSAGKWEMHTRIHFLLL